MLGIAQVAIKGFQSHVDSNFTLAPGLTVITGPSDAGKTAVIRALRWLAFNEPQGEAFLHTVRNPDGSVRSACDEASVTVEFTDGTVITKTRRKGKTTYTHSLYPEPWEKAEVPPEIKETLGLVKQSYGDTFETCLNFAFQLDPPFLLSETGSAGAKVLGKLAGTEVVDKATSAVNKLSHRTRTEVAQAEKTIGQLDVELLEYLEVDQNFAVLLQLEAAYQRTEGKVERHKALFDLSGRYAGLVEHKQGFLDTLHRFADLGKLLGAHGRVTERYTFLQLLQDMDTTFWTQIKVCEAAQKTLGTLKFVKLLRSRLNTVTDQEQRVAVLTDLGNRYSATMEATATAQGEIDKAAVVLALSSAVGLLSDNLARVTVLQTVAERHRIAVDALNKVQATVDTLKATDALQGKIEGLRRITESLDTYKYLLDHYDGAQSSVTACQDFLQAAAANIQTVQAEITAAWEEAGGVCPMCGQVIERGPDSEKPVCNT